MSDFTIKYVPGLSTQIATAPADTLLTVTVCDDDSDPDSPRRVIVKLTAAGEVQIAADATDLQLREVIRLLLQPLRKGGA